MPLIVSLPWLFLTQPHARRRIGLLETTRIRMRVMPWDCDLNLHMNNGRYIWRFELARYVMTHQLGLSRQVFKARWLPVLGALSVRFRRGLAPLARYEIETAVKGWDEKWFYIEQTMLRPDGESAARAFIKVLLRAPSGPVPIAEVLKRIGHAGDSPELPNDLALWREINRSPAERGLPSADKLATF